MALSSHTKPVKRKPATYGKPSARRTFGFDSADEHEDSREDGASSPGSILKSASRSERKAPIQARLPKSPASLSRPSSTPGSQSQPDSEPDMYDVPSSDGDNTMASPHPPAAKKRRVPQKAGRKTNAREVTKSHLGDIPRSNDVREVKSPKQKNFSIRRKEEDGIPSLVPTMPDRAFGSRDKLPSTVARFDAIKKAQPSLSAAWEPDPEPNLLSTEPRKAASPKRKHTESGAPDDLNNRPSTPESHFWPQSSTIHPMTPPSSTQLAQAITPSSAGLTSVKKTPDFMSPSNLEIPRLAISGSTISQQFHTKTSSLASQMLVPATAGRSKLKDRLTARNGDSRPDTDVEDVESGSSEEDPMETTIRPSDLAPGSLASGDMGFPKIEMGSQESSKFKLSGGPRQTYSAKTRTLRRDEADDDILTSLAMDEDDGEFAKASRRIRVEPKLPTKQNDDDDMEFPDEEEGATSKLKNIHELRQAGASARLLGETEAVLEEADSDNRSTMCWGLLNLVIKLQDLSFCNSLLSTGSESRVLNRTEKDLDMSSRTLLSMAILQLLTQQIPRHTLEQYLENTVFFLGAMLKESQSVGAIARDRKSNFTKSFQQELLGHCKKYARSPVWTQGEPNQITPQLLALQLLERYVRRLREAGFRERFLQPTSMRILFELLTEFESSLSEEGRDLEYDIGLRLSISILESSSLMTEASSQQKPTLWRPSYLEMLAQLLGSVPSWRPTHQGDTLSLLLRLCLNITNGDTGACDFFANKHVIGAAASVVHRGFEDISSDATAEMHALKVDNLILALGFLINLAERSQSSQECFLRSSGDGSVPLHVLLDVFATRWLQAFEVTSEQESRTNVPLGYLAVLLTFLCSRRSIRSIVASRLEGGTLRHLLVAADAFLSYNKKVTEEVQMSEDGADLKAHFLNRLEALIDELKLDLTDAS